MQIGELAAALSVTTKTLRHYERIGLIPEAERTGAGYRVFSAAAMRRARLVVDLRRLGLSLEAIRGVLDADGPSLRVRVLGLLDQEVQRHALEIAVLQGRHDDLDARLRALLTEPGAGEACICAALMRPCDCDADEGRTPVSVGADKGS